MSFACSRAPWSVSCVGFFCSSCVLRFIYVVHGLPSWLNSKEPTCRLQFRNHRICGFDSWVGKTPWRRKWHPAPGFWPGKSHGQRRLAAYSPGGCKSQTRGSACVSVVVSVFVSFLFLPQFISLVDRLVSCFLFGFLWTFLDIFVNICSHFSWVDNSGVELNTEELGPRVGIRLIL